MQRVCAHECLMEQESIQCDGCGCWLHQQRIGMSTAQYLAFSQPHTYLESFCRHCIGKGDGYNFSSGLAQIAVCSPDMAKMKAKAESEHNFCSSMKSLCHRSAMYLVQMSQSINNQQTYFGTTVHDCSISTLVDVAGDRNCLYRVVRIALYGKEAAHVLLRLLAATEVLLHPSFYDNTSSVQLHQPPIILLYTQEQINNIRTLCAQQCSPELRSVLSVESVDRTFNLSSLFVTVIVYKNKKVVLRRSQEPPTL